MDRCGPCCADHGWGMETQEPADGARLVQAADSTPGAQRERVHGAGACIQARQQRARRTAGVGLPQRACGGRAESGRSPGARTSIWPDASGGAHMAGPAPTSPASSGLRRPPAARPPNALGRKKRVPRTY